MKMALNSHIHANGRVPVALYFIAMPHRISLGHHWQRKSVKGKEEHHETLLTLSFVVVMDDAGLVLS